LRYYFSSEPVLDIGQIVAGEVMNGEIVNYFVEIENSGV